MSRFLRAVALLQGFTRSPSSSWRPVKSSALHDRIRELPSEHFAIFTLQRHLISAPVRASLGVYGLFLKQGQEEEPSLTLAADNHWRLRYPSTPSFTRVLPGLMCTPTAPAPQQRSHKIQLAVKTAERYKSAEPRHATASHLHMQMKLLQQALILISTLF